MNLYGFDGYASGALRLDAAMELLAAAPHDHAEEQAWLRAHAAEIDDITRELVIGPRTLGAWAAAFANRSGVRTAGPKADRA